MIIINSVGVYFDENMSRENWGIYEALRGMRSIITSLYYTSTCVGNELLVLIKRYRLLIAG